MEPHAPSPRSTASNGRNEDGPGHRQLPERLDRQKNGKQGPWERLASSACISALLAPPPCSSTWVMCRPGPSLIAVYVKTAS